MAVLCQHTHSDQPSLRLNALWALKHLIVAVGPELKKACLEELGPGWLVQLIQDDTQQDDEDMYTSPPVVAEQPQQQGGHRWMYGRDGGLRELDGTGSWRTRQAEDKLRAVREAESQPTRRVRNDEVAIQEQGLDLIRNLIGIPGVGLGTEAGTETSDMIDHLFRELGQDRLFELLASKLRPRYVHALSRRAPTAGREARVLHPVPQVIVPAVYILVQMAGSDARHRQLVVAQTDLLRQLAQYSGRDKEVRIALCHLVTNLATHEDDDGDVEGGRARAAELKRLGFHDKMDEYRLEDRELDVRERAKLAVFHLDQAGLAPF